MIPHRYTYANDNVAQWSADQIDRQEITINFYLDNLTDEPVWIWVGGEDYGLDPWRITYDPAYDLKSGQRLFAQRDTLRKHNLSEGNVSGFRVK